MTRWNVKTVVPAAGEQITLAEAKLHLRVDDDGGSPPAHPDDPLITALISAAREWCEGYTGLALVPQTFELGGSSFGSSSLWMPCSCYRYSSDGVSQQYNSYVELPMGPVSSVAQVTYIDGEGAEQTIASSDYVLDDYSNPARLYTAFGSSWPTAQNSANSSRIRYRAGYDLPADSPNPNPIPFSIVQAMKLIIGHLYENRENTTDANLELLPLGAMTLLDRYRVRVGVA
jgi:uncharacterized phiE125 gp8 family phage protein